MSAIEFAQALAIVRDVAHGHRLETEFVPAARAHGRVLAEDLSAPMPLPPFDNSAMDGYAFRHADLATVAGEGGLRLAGEQFAGRATGQVVGAGECVAITTGAPMPPGTDTVAILEAVRCEGGRVQVPGALAAGANVRLAGEDTAAGDVVLRAGQVLTPLRCSLVAALGVATLAVARRPTVAVFTTGDELVAPGLPLAPGRSTIRTANCSRGCCAPRAWSRRSGPRSPTTRAGSRSRCATRAAPSTWWSPAVACRPAARTTCPRSSPASVPPISGRCG